MREIVHVLSDELVCGAPQKPRTGFVHERAQTGGVDPESFVHCKYIVIWACNSISTNLHHWPFVLEARKRGAKVVVIDSYRSRTAKQADWHLATRESREWKKSSCTLRA